VKAWGEWRSVPYNVMLAQGGSEWSFSHSSRCIPKERAPIARMSLMGPTAGLDALEGSLVP